MDITSEGLTMTWKNGLPPVGEKIRCAGITGDVIAVQGDYVWIKPCNSTIPVTGWLSDAKPLKSQAELKREKAVEEMVHDSKTLYGTHSYTHIADKHAEQLYDAGYRKVNELTDEQIKAIAADWNDRNFTLLDLAIAVREAIMGEES